MTNQRTSRRDLSVILFLAIALSNSAALAQNLSQNLRLRTSDGNSTVQVGTPVSFVADVSPISCDPPIGCTRHCHYPAGLLRLRQDAVPEDIGLETGPVAVPPTAALNCAAPIVLSFPFSSSVNGPAGSRVFEVAIVNAADGTTVVDSAFDVGVTWNKATSSTSSVGLGPKPGLILSDTPVTLSATVTGFAPSRTVKFKDGSRIVASATATNPSGAIGPTTFQTTTTLNPGAYNLVAEYEGDDNNHSSSTPPSAALAFTVTISPAHAAALLTIIESLLLDD